MELLIIIEINNTQLCFLQRMLFNELKIIILMFFSEHIDCNLHVVIYLDNCEYIVNVVFQTLYLGYYLKPRIAICITKEEKLLMLTKFELFITPFTLIFLQDCQCVVS